MSTLKLLNQFVLIENILGIYRNYINQETKKKFWIIFYILLQTSLHSIIVSGQLYLLFIEDVYNEISYISCSFLLSSLISSLTSVATGISNSRTFVLYIDNINRVSKRFEDDKTYVTSLKFLYRFSITFILVSITFAVLRSYYIIINFTPKDYTTYKILVIPVILSQTLLRITILFEKVMFFVCVMLVVYLCKCLNALISSIKEKVGRDLCCDEQSDITKEKIQGWVELYMDLSRCCDNITLSFGRQFYFSLLMAISYFILLTYEMFYLSASNAPDKTIIIVIIIYVLLTICPIIAGQLAHNEGLKLHRVFARLYNTIAVYESSQSEAKLIKDFIRLIKKNPIEVKLLSNLLAGTYLLPFILMTSVNYIIVMLQFSNIV